MESLERLRILYDDGLLTRGDLYDRITKLGAGPDAAARVFSDTALLEGLAAWQHSVAGGGHAFGGEWSDAEAYRAHPVDPDEFSSDDEREPEAAARTSHNPDCVFPAGHEGDCATAESLDLKLPEPHWRR